MMRRWGLIPHPPVRTGSLGRFPRIALRFIRGYFRFLPPGGNELAGELGVRAGIDRRRRDTERVTRSRCCGYAFMRLRRVGRAQCSAFMRQSPASGYYRVPEILTKNVKSKMQILRLTTPKLKDVWGPVRSE